MVVISGLGSVGLLGLMGAKAIELSGIMLLLDRQLERVHDCGTDQEAHQRWGTLYT